MLPNKNLSDLQLKYLQQNKARSCQMGRITKPQNAHKFILINRKNISWQKRKSKCGE